MRANIQPGHIARHTPRGIGAQGKEAAVIDVAQDFLLAHMDEAGLLDGLAIKGGTAIRKLYAGGEGRFSLDLDFAVYGQLRSDAAELFVAETDGLFLPPFTYGISQRRGKWSITLKSPFTADISLMTKLDFAEQPWLNPVKRGWVPMPIHAQYGFELPSIRTVRLEENIAEKIARLNRTTTARDMYDLSWIMRSPSVAQELDTALIRRLAVLKIWVDTNGMHAGAVHWRQGHQGSVFDAEKWLRKRRPEEFDIDDIGALSASNPTAEQLSLTVAEKFSFLSNLDEQEQIIARSDPRDRSLVIKALSKLPDITFDPEELY